MKKRTSCYDRSMVNLQLLNAIRQAQLVGQDLIRVVEPLQHVMAEVSKSFAVLEASGLRKVADEIERHERLRAPLYGGLFPPEIPMPRAFQFPLANPDEDEPGEPVRPLHNRRVGFAPWADEG